MKITAEHQTHILSEINAVLDRSELTISQVVANYKERSLSMQRMRWDLLYAAKLSKWLCDNIYSYANDEHIDTVLRNITNTK